MMKAFSHDTFTPTEPGTGFDLNAIDQAFRDEPELLAELVAIFREELPLQLDRFEEALAQGDVMALRRAAHQFIGSCIVFGASGCVALGRQVEDCPDGASEQMRGTVVTLSAMAWRLLATLESHVGLEASGASGSIRTGKEYFA